LAAAEEAAFGENDTEIGILVLDEINVAINLGIIKNRRNYKIDKK
jgi:hypothetical protein